MNNSQIRRRRRATARAVRIGMRLGLLVFTAYLTARLCRAGLEVIESRTGAPGGEIFISPDHPSDLDRLDRSEGIHRPDERS